MESLGKVIKNLRENANMPQRRLASELDLDVAVLSRIENDNNFPKKRVSEIISRLSILFDVSEKELRQIYLSDTIVYLISDEDDFEDILKVTEEKMKYYKSVPNTNLKK